MADLCFPVAKVAASPDSRKWPIGIALDWDGCPWASPCPGRQGQAAEAAAQAPGTALGPFGPASLTLREEAWKDGEG
jgi:hypothetical protein